MGHNAGLRHPLCTAWLSSCQALVTGLAARTIRGTRHRQYARKHNELLSFLQSTYKFLAGLESLLLQSLVKITAAVNDGSMNHFHTHRRHFSCALRLALVLSFFFCATCLGARAQTAAEAAGATSTMAGAAANAKPPVSAVKLPESPDSKDKAVHLPATSGPPPDVANRRALEAKAGPNAGKLLLRSVPSGARVFIDGAFIGKSPMLLLLAPGKYRVEFRGPRMEYATSVVGLLPRETQEIALTLAVRYPTRAFVH